MPLNAAGLNPQHSATHLHYLSRSLPASKEAHRRDYYIDGRRETLKHSPEITR